MLSWLKKINSRSAEDGNFFLAIRQITGCRPKNLGLYKLALRHSSAPANKKQGHKLNNERLEYLGDAILGGIVADYLYRNFPIEEEGFLTSMRSKIVSRQSLNTLGEELGLPSLLVKGPGKRLSSKSLYGNALEALVGALYLDCGYKKNQTLCRGKTD
jgi:ribonuclease-3